jgi:hypothetical protein
MPVVMGQRRVKQGQDILFEMVFKIIQAVLKLRAFQGLHHHSTRFRYPKFLPRLKDVILHIILLRDPQSSVNAADYITAPVTFDVPDLEPGEVDVGWGFHIHFGVNHFILS